MQDKKIRASINAKFDPNKGNLLAKISGGNVDLCYLLGILVRQLARSHARVAGCTESDALDKTLKSIALVAENTPGNGTTIDLSRKYEED